MKTITLLIFSLGLLSAQTTRNVTLSWTASTTSGVIGYNVFRAVGSGAPVQVNTSPITSTNYTDSTAVVGSTYTYTVTALAAACTSTTPVGTPCGQSAPSAPASTTVPAQPAITVTVTVAVP